MQRMAALQLPRQPLATLWQALGGALWHAAECLADDGVLWMGRRDRRTKKGKVRPARLLFCRQLAGMQCTQLTACCLLAQIFLGIGGKVRSTCRTSCTVYKFHKFTQVLKWFVRCPHEPQLQSCGQPLSYVCMCCADAAK